MARKHGMSTLGIVMTLAGVAVVSVAGYGMATGNSICSLVGACTGKTQAGAPAMVAVSNEAVADADKACVKSCCELGKLAGAARVVAASNEKAAEKAECADACAKACAEKSDCAKACDKPCGEAAAAVTAASNAKADGCCASKAAAVTEIANKAGGFGKCSKSTLAAAKNNQAMGNGFGIVMPAAFYVPASYTSEELTKAGCCRSGAANVSGASTCGDKDKDCCKAGAAAAAEAAAKVTPASNETTKSGCCSGKSSCSEEKAAAVPAAKVTPASNETTKKAGGCCSGKTDCAKGEKEVASR